MSFLLRLCTYKGLTNIVLTHLRIYLSHTFRVRQDHFRVCVHVLILKKLVQLELMCPQPDITLKPVYFHSRCSGKPNVMKKCNEWADILVLTYAVS